MLFEQTRSQQYIATRMRRDERMFLPPRDAICKDRNEFYFLRHDAALSVNATHCEPGFRMIIM